MRPIVLAAIATLFAAIASAQNGWRLDNPSALWSARDSHTVTVFNGRLWLLNGAAGSYFKDAWSSDDGYLWKIEVAELPWLQRTGHTATNFNGRLWVIGGRSQGAYKNDVWSSGDGVNWVEEVPSAPWSPRAAHSVVVFDSRIWVIGGQYPQSTSSIHRYNDVWSSPDGINWVFEGSGPWSPRAGHGAVVHSGRIWVMGGADANDYNNDVWSSGDGITWTQESGAASWARRSGHTTEVFNGRMWLIGGFAQAAHGDVWSSADGVNWILETASANWGRRWLHSSAVFRNRLWVVGGSTTVFKSDVWSYGLHASPDALPDGTAGREYSAALEAREGDAPFSWSIVGGSLPPGVFQASSPSSSTFMIAGTPSELGTYQFTIRLTDSTNDTTDQQITIQINPPPPLQTESSSSTGCALQHVPIPAWLLLPAAVAWFRRRRRLYTT